MSPLYSGSDHKGAFVRREPDDAKVSRPVRQGVGLGNGPRLPTEPFYTTLSPEQKAGIQAVSMDMWEPFFHSPRAPPPEASEKIVVVRFHIMGHVGKAIDTVRKQEVREGWVPELKGSKYLWLYSKENLPESQRQRFEALPGHEPESGTGVGDERGASRPVACDLPGGSPRLLEALVRMGNSKTGHTHARGRSSDQAPFGQCPDIHHASDHQRCERRVELQDPDDQETGLRISEQGPIQDSHLLSLNGLDFYPSWSAQCKWHLFGPLRFPEGPKKDYSIWMDETFIPKLLPEEY